MFFRKNKKVVVGAKTRSTGHVAVTGAQSRLPTSQEWQSQTNGGRSSQSRLNAIYSQLLKYWQPNNDGWTRLACLGEIYFVADSWLRTAERYRHSTNQRDNEKYTLRMPAVERLYVTVVNELCKSAGCSANLLPQVLEELFGRVMTNHGSHIDATPGMAQYLTRAEAERYRIVFDGGWAYMWDPDNPAKRIVADSTARTWEYNPHAGALPDMFEAGFAGFAMSMSRKLYMGNHRGCFSKDNFFHSSYLSGETVLCTGSIYIQNGSVIGLSNDSGHYQPTIEHLATVVQALSAEGVNPAQIMVKAVGHSWLQADGSRGTSSRSMTGDKLLHMRATSGRQLYDRMRMNEELINSRAGGRTYTRVRTLPPLPVR